MKKFMLALLAVSVFGTANAQKGTILKYGTAGLYTDKNDNGGGNETRNFNWHINPGLGYQFTDNITVGLQGGFWSQFNETRTGNPTNTAWTRNAMEMREWQIGAFFRYTEYFGNIFFMYGQLDLSYVQGQDASEMETRTVNFGTGNVDETVVYNYDYYNGFQVMYSPMIGAFVTDGLALNFGFGQIGYRNISYDAPKVSDQNNFVFKWGKQFSFAISKNFAVKHKTGNVKPGDDLRPLKMNDNEDDE